MNRLWSRVLIVVGFLGLWGVPLGEFGLRSPTAAASTVMAMELDALVAASDRIGVGEVLSVSSAWNRGRTNIFTTVEVQIAESWKGAGGRITLTQPGGTVGDIEQRVHWLPVFTPGERSVMFLRGAPIQIVGMGQGRRLLRLPPGERTWIVEGGDRSAAVRRGPDGALRQAESQAPQPLSDFRRQVLSLLGSP